MLQVWYEFEIWYQHSCCNFRTFSEKILWFRQLGQILWAKRVFKSGHLVIFPPILSFLHSSHLITSSYHIIVTYHHIISSYHIIISYHYIIGIVSIKVNLRMLQLWCEFEIWHQHSCFNSECSAKKFCDFVDWVKFYGQKGFSKVETYSFSTHF